MARLPDPARSRAVLIGTSEYQDPDLESLPSVANNLTELRKVLTEPSGAGLPAEHCLELRDPPAQAAVGDLIVTAAAEAQDVLLVYFSGHGLMTWDRQNELCLALRDTRSKSLRTSALRCADLRQYILDSPARTRVLILDCCFAGRGIEPTMANPADTVLGEVDVSGAYVLAATQDKAFAPKDRPHTLFTGELLRVLKEGVPAEKGVLLTLDVLFREVRATMRRNGWPEPRGNTSDMAAHLALGHNAAHQVRQVIGQLYSGLSQLKIEEDQTAKAYQTAIEKIRNPYLPPFTPESPLLRDRLAKLEQQADLGELPSTEEIAARSSELVEAMSDARRLWELASGPMEWRERLRDRLKGYQAMATRLDIDQEGAIWQLYAKARDLLWTKPCDLQAATRAVKAYQRAVTDRREGLA